MGWCYLILGWFAALFAWLAQGVTVPRWWFYLLVAGFAIAVGRPLIGLFVEIGAALRPKRKG